MIKYLGIRMDRETNLVGGVGFGFYMLLGGFESYKRIGMNLGYIFLIPILFYLIPVIFTGKIGSNLSALIQEKKFTKVSILDAIFLCLIPLIFYFILHLSYERVADYEVRTPKILTPMGTFLRMYFYGKLNLLSTYFTLFITTFILALIGAYGKIKLVNRIDFSKTSFRFIRIKTILLTFYCNALFLYNGIEDFGYIHLIIIFFHFLFLLLFLFYYVPKHHHQYEDKFYFIIIIWIILTNIAYFILAFDKANYRDLFDIFFKCNLVQIILLNFVSEYSKLKFNNELIIESEIAKQGVDQINHILNPDFILVALAKIDNLAIHENATLTKQGVAKLSSMLDHLFKVKNGSLVPIETEINHLKNYIDFQLMRHSKNENITIDLKINNLISDYPIPSMIFLPFVENAFKYGVSYNEESFIKIELIKKFGDIIFTVINTVHNHKHLNSLNSYKIGIENTKRRLEIFFPERFELNVIESQREFSLTLILKNK